MTRRDEHGAADVARRILALSGGNADAVELLLMDLDDAIRREQRLAFKERLRCLGQFMHVYGAGNLWRALYIRFGCDVTTAPGAWSLDEWYRHNDEWRFVYGDGWRQWVSQADLDANAETLSETPSPGHSRGRPSDVP